MRLKRTAIPTLLLHPNQPVVVTVSDRDLRHRRREQTKVQAEEAMEVDDNNNEPASEEAQEPTEEETIEMLQKKIASQENIISTLKSKLRTAQRQNLRLKKKQGRAPATQADKLKMAKQILVSKSKWSPQQVDFLLHEKSQAQWAKEDIVLGLTLRAVSRKAYQILRRKKLLPLPSLTTLRRHIQNFKCMPGLQHDVLQGEKIIQNFSFHKYNMFSFLFSHLPAERSSWRWIREASACGLLI